ncbi:DsbA family oxidoreductase [Streptomyces sp. NPDC096311]|uniref:DsbA family oxidoreductase n=1 Tax=Streptomyces sp. NPDC096311 TaxID=3366083 RepID=UPI0038266F36
MTQQSMLIEVWGDIGCPWCYVGRARFEQALAAFEHRDEVRVVHRSLQLHADQPRGEVMPVLEAFTRRYGATREQAEAGERKMAHLATAEGLPFSTDRLHGNTLDAHRLLQLARERGRQGELMAALYRAHFSAESSVFDPSALAAIAVECGLETVEVLQVIDGDAYTDAVRDDERRAADLGIRGVPSYLFDGVYAVHGGQSVEAYGAALASAWHQGPRGSASSGTDPVSAITCADGRCAVPGATHA